MQETAAQLREALAHYRAGRPGLAERCCRAALATGRAAPEVWHLRGLLLSEAGRFAEAANCLGHTASQLPDAASVWADLGACLHRLGRHGEAAVVLRHALRLAPTLEPALGCLGLVLAASGDAEAAEGCFRAALRLRPDSAATRTNLGNLLREQGRLAAAEAELRAALALRPEAPDGQHNLAVALASLGRLAEAEACCRAALRIDPGHADAHFTLGTTLLLAGRLVEGWEGFEWRWRRRGFAPPRGFVVPRWDGGPFTGRTMLLHAEQGLGDAIQMLRFVPAIAARGKVVLEVPAALARLAEGLGVPVTVAGEALPRFDLECALMSLPAVLRVTLGGIPVRVPYLDPPPAARAAWRLRLAALPGLRVGLAWAGNPQYPADARRSLPPARLAALAGLPGISFVSLQPHAAARPPLALHDWTGELADLAETAALIAGLDLVITVDSAVAHLAGALGIQVWLLNRFDTCWRWMRDRADSPWYPTLRLFRQPRPGDWDAALTLLRAALLADAAAFASRPPPAGRGAG